MMNNDTGDGAKDSDEIPEAEIRALELPSDVAMYLRENPSYRELARTIVALDCARTSESAPSNFPQALDNWLFPRGRKNKPTLGAQIEVVGQLKKLILKHTHNLESLGAILEWTQKHPHIRDLLKILDPCKGQNSSSRPSLKWANDIRGETASKAFARVVELQLSHWREQSNILISILEWKFGVRYRLSSQDTRDLLKIFKDLSAHVRPENKTFAALYPLASPTRKQKRLIAQMDTILGRASYSDDLPMYRYRWARSQHFGPSLQRALMYSEQHFKVVSNLLPQFQGPALGQGKEREKSSKTAPRFYPFESALELLSKKLLNLNEKDRIEHATRIWKAQLRPPTSDQGIQLDRKLRELGAITGEALHRRRKRNGQ